MNQHANHYTNEVVPFIMKSVIILKKLT